MCTREINGETAEFGTTGYTMGSIFVLYDRNGDSIWYPQSDTTMDAVAGPNSGLALEILAEPSPIPLGEWLDVHPESLVLLPGPEETARRSRVRLGVQLHETSSRVTVKRVGEETPAMSAGIRAGDEIVEVGGVPIEDASGLRAALGDFELGDSSTVLVEREGERIELEVTFQ